MPSFIVSSPSHFSGDESVRRIMFSVVICLIPATLAAVYFFGFDALRVVAVSVVGALVVEWIFIKILGTSGSIFDGSAVVTGLLLALNLPSSAPWWLVLVGVVVGIGLGKHAFGGLGNNPFNPALVARVFLLISWPVEMTTWPKAQPLLTKTVDAVTGATPLGVWKTDIIMKGTSEAAKKIPFSDLFMGSVGGSLGEVSAAMILLGALYLLYRGYITWHIPVSFILSVAVFTGILWAVQPDKYMNPIFHILSGGLFLGAFFMATDMVTSPVTTRGMLVFGTGCGLITALIRLFGGYPEGVSFAILIMNATTPLIDKYIKTKPFGTRIRK